MVADEYRPDCGYAWVVVAACFTINFIMAGLARAAGVLYIALIDVYGVSRETATAPFSLRFCIRNLSGPVVGALGQHFGIRPIVLLGGLICGLGGILSALAPDVTWITVAWGGLHGLGYGMCNIIHLIILNRYFKKYKGLALGISLTGDCFGTFLLPPVLEFLLSTYDLRGTFLIMAGVSLNVVPAAMLLKSPPWEKRYPRTPFPSLVQSASKNDSVKTIEEGKLNKGFAMSESCDDKNNVQNHLIPIITIGDPEINRKLCFSNQQEVNNENKVSAMVETTKGNNNTHYIDYPYDINKNNFINDILIYDIHTLRQSSSLRVTDCESKKRRFRLNTFNSQNRRLSAASILSCPSHIGKFNFDSLLKSSVNSRKCRSESQKDVHHMKQRACFQEAKHLKAVNESQSSLPILHLREEDVLNELNLYEGGKTSVEVHEVYNNNSTINAARNFVRTNIKPIFLVISATLALYVFLFISVFTIIVDYVQDNGIPSECGKYLIIAFSVTDIFGRIGFGVVLDKKWMSLRHYTIITVGLMGFFIAIIPFYKCFTFWMISFSLCGLVQGGVAIVFPVFVEYYIDKNEETVALGCLNFYGGILMLPIPPMIGYFRDNVGSYDGVFWTVGASCIFAASLWIFEPCLFRKQRGLSEATSYVEGQNNNRKNAY